MFGDSGMCAEVAEVYGTMSCLIVMSDRAVTEGSKYFELGQQPHEVLTQNTCYDNVKDDSVQLQENPAYQSVHCMSKGNVYQM